MSKTIDVRPGDTWTIDDFGNLWQHRDEKARVIGHEGKHRWMQKSPLNERENILPTAAKALAASWGYTLTAPDEKPTETPAPTVKPDLTVPQVDVVWVEGSFGDGKTFLTPHPTVKCANGVVANIRRARNGTARIVRLAPDPDLAATVKRLEERLSKLEATVSDLQSDAAKHDNELELLRLKAATTTAKVRVVLPEIPGWATDDRVTAGWNSCIVQVKLALSAAGVEVKEASK